MSTLTTTIRIPVTTRDRLNAQASERGISVAALLDEWSNSADRQAAFAEERAATRAEAVNPAVIDEDRDWQLADTDGID